MAAFLVALVAVLSLALGGCRSLSLDLRLVKIGVVAPLSGPHYTVGYQWVDTARSTVSTWNTAVLGGSPSRIALVIYDEGEGPEVGRRLATDPAVIGALVPASVSPPQGVPALIIPGRAIDQHLDRMLRAVSDALDHPPERQRAAVRAALNAHH